MDARRIDVTKLGANSYLVVIGDTHLAVNYVELRALGYEVAEALDGRTS